MVDDVGGFWWFLEPLLPDTHLTSSDHIILNASDFNASLCIALPSIPSVWNAHHQWRKWNKSIRFGLEGIQYQNQNHKKKTSPATGEQMRTGSLFSRTCAPASMHHRSHCSWRHTAKGWDPCACSTPRGNGSKESWGSKGGVVALCGA